jgi:hypothetical protein
MSQVSSQMGGIVPPGAGVQFLQGDVGLATGPDLAGIIEINGGANINTVSNPGATSVVVNLNNSVYLPATGAAGASGVYGIDGFNVLHTMGGAGNGNIFVGSAAGNYTLTGVANSTCGQNALRNLTTGHHNCAFGTNSLLINTVGSFNTSLGSGASQTNISGNNNIHIGLLAGTTANAAASNNIIIGSLGMPVVSDTIIIGDAQTANYQAGIYTQPIGATNRLVSIDDTNKLGTLDSIYLPRTAAPGTSGVIFIDNIPVLHTKHTGAPDTNIFVGQNAGNFTVTGASNTALGSEALISLTTGGANVAVGSGALRSNISGESNVAIGLGTLSDVTTGDNNIAVGEIAGSGLDAAAHDNICIGNIGNAGANRTIFLGELGTHTTNYQQGIYNQPLGITNYPVYIDNLGKMGTIIGGFYAYVTNNQFNVTGGGAATEVLLGADDILTTQYNYNACFYPGDGVGAPAVFTAFGAGIYSFSFTVDYRQALIGSPYGSRIQLFMTPVVGPVFYEKLYSTLSFFDYGPGIGIRSGVTQTVSLYLDNLTQVRFSVTAYGNPGLIGFYAVTTHISGNRIS